MIRRPPRATRTDTLFPYTTLFRSEILDKIDLLRSTKYAAIKVPDNYLPRLAQMAREGARHTAQALQQMGPARRLTTLVATLRELEATLSDAAISMFSALVGRANLNARKRLEETNTDANDQGRLRRDRKSKRMNSSP